MSLRSLMLCAALLAITPIVSAGNLAEVRKQIESSLSVSGQIRIDAAGNVLDYTLDQPEALPKGITDMIERLAPQWTFEPVELAGNTVSRSRMNLLFVASKLDDGNVRIELRSASFDAELPENERIAIGRRGRMPDYPDQLMAMDVHGTVYLKLQIGRDGKVMNIDATHVNLRTLGSESEMARWRRLFTQSCIKAVRGWTFTPPTAGEEANAPFWIGTLPVAFTLNRAERPQPGRWETYVPGPRKLVPWADSVGITADNSDALPPNQLHTSSGGRRLITPLGGG